MKKLCLGTAMWGWSVDEDMAYSILDCFYSNGYRYIDTANNYPLNGIKKDYHKSEMFISKWCKSRGVKDLKITYKIGSLSNSYTHENDLSPPFMSDQINRAIEIFTENLHIVMIHWDNRNNLSLIKTTIEFLNDYLIKNNLILGISGIKHTDIYKTIISDIKISEVNIQSKHNFLYSDLSKYRCFSEINSKLWGYGISVSGLKLSSEDYNKNSYVSLTRENNYHKNTLNKNIEILLHDIISRHDLIKSLYHIATIFSEQEDRLHGYIVAPSSLKQMQDIINFLANVNINAINLDSLKKLNKL